MAHHRGRRRNVAVATVSPLAWLIPNATVFVSSACIMMIELVAGRIISRHLGSSVYTWTSVIGIVLAGIAVGNYLGGLLADRHSSKETLAKLFMGAAAVSGAITALDSLATDWSALWMLSWPVRVASHVFIAFFFPTAVLGMISPLVAKRALDLGRQKGRTIGDIYAWGVVGSIVGTFLAGFYLIAALGTRGVVWSVAGTLALMAILYCRKNWATWACGLVVAFFAILALGPSQALARWGERLALRESRSGTVLYANESQYSYVEVFKISEDPDTRGMQLDTLLHSQIDMENPANFHYDYEKVYSAITDRLRPNSPHVDSLTIGGGGYVYPRYMGARYPGSRTDVAEIDPAVTEASFAAFGLPRDTAINCYHEDGRVFIDRLLRRKQDGDPVELYDVIYCDAVNDYNVPYQLTTLEFMRKVHRLIEPDGAYLMNMIDIYDSGLLLGSLVNTMKQVFPYVYVFVEGIPVTQTRSLRNTFIISGLNQPFDTENLGALYHADCKIFALTDDDLAKLERKSAKLVLTDDFAPVENLLADVVKDASAEKAAVEWLRRAQIANAERAHAEASDICETALELFPDNVRLLNEFGTSLRLRGDVYEAIAKHQKVLRKHANDSDAHLGLVECYSALGEVEKTLPHFLKVLDRQPFNVTLKYNYGRILSELGRHREAIEQFTKAVKIKPDFANAFNNWGVALFRLGDRDGAIDRFRRAVELDPDHPEAGPNLKSLLAAKERDEQAILALLEIVKLTPNDPAAHVQLGDAYYTVRNAKDALASYDEALRIDPIRAQAHFARGNALAALGRLQEAAAAYREALHLKPDLTEAQKRLRDTENRLRSPAS